MLLAKNTQEKESKKKNESPQREHSSPKGISHETRKPESARHHTTPYPSYVNHTQTNRQ